MLTNTVAWLPFSHARHADKFAPYNTRKNDELFDKDHVLAINSIDRQKQSNGAMDFPLTKYRFILGSHVVDKVVKVGPSVTPFQVGD